MCACLFFGLKRFRGGGGVLGKIWESLALAFFCVASWRPWSSPEQPAPDLPGGVSVGGLLVVSVGSPARRGRGRHGRLLPLGPPLRPGRRNPWSCSADPAARWVRTRVRPRTRSWAHGPLLFGDSLILGLLSFQEELHEESGWYQNGLQAKHGETRSPSPFEALLHFSRSQKSQNAKP